MLELNPCIQRVTTFFTHSLTHYDLLYFCVSSQYFHDIDRLWVCVRMEAERDWEKGKEGARCNLTVLQVIHTRPWPSWTTWATAFHRVRWLEPNLVIPSSACMCRPQLKQPEREMALHELGMMFACFHLALGRRTKWALTLHHVISPFPESADCRHKCCAITTSGIL